MKSRTSVMISIVLAMLVSSMDATIMNTTMPVIAHDLGRFDLYAWAFASYMICSTVLSPVAGRLSDLFGRKRVFAFGIVFFLIGSLLSGVSQNMIQLVIFRALQGVGAGFMIPFPAIIAGDLFPIEQRGKIQALFTGMWGLSAVLAPLLGAFFVQYMTWRWIFYVNLPISILAFVALLPYKEVYTPKKSTVDVIGAVLFGTGVSLLLLDNVVKTNRLLYGVIGVILLILFVFYEKKQQAPIVPISMINDKYIRWVNVNGFLGCLALFGMSSYIPMFLQQERHETIIVSGLALLGTSIGWMGVAVPAGKWIIRFGFKPLLLIGNALLLISGVLLYQIHATTGFWYIFVILIVYGAAFGLTFTVALIAAQQLVEPHQKGISTSFLMFCRNIGTAVGITIMGSFLNNVAFMTGFHDILFFGLIGSVVAFLTSFLIKGTRIA
jgi:EmrB/QacA subfamily drug resistance transporter